jgi:hypothetical protein
LRAEHRESDGTDEQGGGKDSKDALQDHMNSFSFLRSAYSPATNSA